MGRLVEARRILLAAGAAQMDEVDAVGELPDHRRQVVVGTHARSEEHTSELQSLMRNSYAVFCLKKKTDVVIRVCPTSSRKSGQEQKTPPQQTSREVCGS